MNIVRIIKFEYFEKAIILDLEELSSILIDVDQVTFHFRHQKEIIISRNLNDTNFDLKRLSLNVYSALKKYTENMEIVTRMMED